MTQSLMRTISFLCLRSELLCFTHMCTSTMGTLSGPLHVSFNNLTESRKTEKHTYTHTTLPSLLHVHQNNLKESRKRERERGKKQLIHRQSHQINCTTETSNGLLVCFQHSPIKAASFFELDGGKQHFKPKEPKRVRDTSHRFSQYTKADLFASFSYLALSVQRQAYAKRQAFERKKTNSTLALKTVQIKNQYTQSLMTLHIKRKTGEKKKRKEKFHVGKTPSTHVCWEKNPFKNTTVSTPNLFGM